MEMVLEGSILQMMSGYIIKTDSNEFDKKLYILTLPFYTDTQTTPHYLSQKTLFFSSPQFHFVHITRIV